MGVSIGQIFEEIGGENISIQHLAESTLKVKDNQKHKDTEITFVTGEISSSDIMNDCDKTAVICWVNRSDYNRAVKKLNK